MSEVGGREVATSQTDPVALRYYDAAKDDLAAGVAA